MSAVLGWLSVVVVLGVAGAVLGAVLVAVGLMLFGGVLEDVDPRRRFWMLSALSFSPLVAGMLVLLVAFYPSLLDAFGLVSDHCGTHPGHSLHLCFLHHPPPPVSMPLLVLTLVPVAFVTRRWIGEIATTTGSLRWAHRLIPLARFDEERQIYIVESDRLLAMTVGFFRRRIVICDRLESWLTPEQFAAVIAHERAHCRRFDGVITFVLRLATACHFPEVRAQLAGAIQLSSEQCCDQAAAAVDDRFTVAEAILAVERIRQQPKNFVGVQCFCTPGVEQRVMALLRNDWRLPNGPLSSAVALVVVVLLFNNLHALHHLVEHGFAWLV